MEIDLPNRERLLQSFTCFAILPTKVLSEIALKMQEVDYQPGDEIVIEETLVDSVYVIVRGQAEVTKVVPQHKKKQMVPVASLRSGDAIGLNDIGFYSTNAKRTATVIARTSMLLLKLDIRDLNDCLKKYEIDSSLYKTSRQMLSVYLIKQSLPFTHLSHERLLWLANKVEEEIFPAQAVVFHQGEEGNKCYLIQNGEIEIFTKENEQEKRLAVLKTPALFGEAMLIANAPRNASARALSETTLLSIRYDYLVELLESEKSTAKMFMTLMVDRSRPIRNPQVTLHTSVTADAQEIFILKNNENGQYFKLSTEGAFIWKNLDGQHTLQEITLNLSDEFDVFAPDMVASLISKLAKNQFITEVLVNDEDYFIHTSTLKQKFLSLKRYFSKRYIFDEGDKWIKSIYDKYVYHLFSYPSLLLMPFILLIGLIVFILETRSILHFFSMHHVSLFLILGLIPLSILKVFLHELGHAFAVKKCHRDIKYFGIGLNGFVATAFADTSDMWLAKPKERVFVNLAGVSMDLLSAAISSLLILVIANHYIQGMLWLFALYTYLGSIRHLNPTQDTDGYFVLMDLLEKNRLRHQSVAWLVKKFPQALRHPHLFLENKAEVSYWLACFVYLVLVTIFTYLIQSFIFVIIGIQSINLYLLWVLVFPFFVLVFSSLNILMEIRKEAE